MIFVTWTGSCTERSFYSYLSTPDIIGYPGRYRLSMRLKLPWLRETTEEITQHFRPQARMAYAQLFHLKISSENFHIQQNKKTVTNCSSS